MQFVDTSSRKVESVYEPSGNVLLLLGAVIEAGAVLGLVKGKKLFAYSKWKHDLPASHVFSKPNYQANRECDYYRDKDGSDSN